jgi:hypothetical protein
MIDNAGGNIGLDYFDDPGPTDAGAANIADTGFTNNASSGQTAFTNWHITSATFDTTQMVCGLDGVDGTPTVTALTWPNSTLRIPGPAFAAGLIWWGDIGEVLVCAPALTGGEDTSVITYLKSRWNIV